MSYFTGTDAQTLLDITPERKSIDFKLVYRPPIDKWTSTGGRTILIGDAAHANLPTAGQGASQAVEDAITVAYCLQNCERDVRLALEATQRIRFHRSNAVHKSGQANRDAFFKTPWEDIEADPDKFTRKRWPKLKIWDPLEFAEKQFPKVAKDIKDNVSGSPEELAIPVPDGGYWYGPGS
jgi:2-polyprenyl-6-methoxyphenol hydroxylase-like FAD-dependent oxidoreductase